MFWPWALLPWPFSLLQYHFLHSLAVIKVSLGLQEKVDYFPVGQRSSAFYSGDTRPLQ